VNTQVTHSHDSASVVRVTTQVNGENRNSTPRALAMPKHAKFNHDPSRGFISPYVRNGTSKTFTRLFWVLPKPHRRGPRTDIHANTSNDAVLLKDVPFQG